MPTVDSFLAVGDATDLLKREAVAQVGVSTQPMLTERSEINI